MANESTLDKLTSQLTELPNIIGRLGISIATAQKALNADYVTALQQIMQIANATAQAALLSDAIKEAQDKVTKNESPAANEDATAKAAREKRPEEAKADLAALRKLDHAA